MDAIQKFFKNNNKYMVVLCPEDHFICKKYSSYARPYFKDFLQFIDEHKDLFTLVFYSKYCSEQEHVYAILSEVLKNTSFLNGVKYYTCGDSKKNLEIIWKDFPGYDVDNTFYVGTPEHIIQQESVVYVPKFEKDESSNSSNWLWDLKNVMSDNLVGLGGGDLDCGAESFIFYWNNYNSCFE